MSAEVIIRKQSIRITAPDEQLAFECRHYMNEQIVPDLSRVYEHVFFQSNDSRQYLTIDRLKIDMGSMTASELKHNFLELLEEKLIIELKYQFEREYQIDDDEQRQNSPSAAAEKPEPITYSTKAEQGCLALLHFLQTGSFTWWYAKQHSKGPAELLQDFNQEERSQFLLRLMSQARSRSSSSAAANMIKRLYIHLAQAEYAMYCKELSRLYADTSIQTNIQTILDQKEDVLRLFRMTEQDFYEHAVFCLLMYDDKPDLLKIFLTNLQGNFPVNRAEQENLPEALLVAGLTQRPEDQKREVFSKESIADKRTETDESIYISNSGLVILHPFLPAFFEAMGFLDKNSQFISPETQRRAAVLLYYLQCGTPNYKEWEMPLNKILCGMGTAALIPDNIHLTDYEIQEANLLLESVVEHWSALRACSIEALQTSFLIREGKIRLKENAWLLQVERSGIDILLDRLPWGIGTIKLPWLEEIISVEW